MREIRFRGKRKDNGKWVYGYYVNVSWITCCSSHRIYTGEYEDDDETNTPIWFEVIPETVGQYTGLKDKHGIEIFEGNIVKTDDFSRGAFFGRPQPTIKQVVEWDEYRLGYVFHGLSLIPKSL